VSIDFNIVHRETLTSTDTTSVGGIPFPLRGGRYGLTARSPTWGTLTLKKLAGDGSTYVTVASFSADGVQTIYLPSGKYQVTAPGGGLLSIVRQLAS